jgi:hypothetical protein
MTPAGEHTESFAFLTSILMESREAQLLGFGAGAGIDRKLPA